MTTCSESPDAEARDVTVGVWQAEIDDAIVVQIDTGDRTGRLRVNLNDAVIWDGDPDHDVDLGMSKAFGPMDVARATALLPEISDEVAAHVLSYFGAGGYAPGSHVSHVLAAIATADPHRFALLSSIYADYCAAMILARTTDAGVDALRGVMFGRHGGGRG